MSKVTIATHNGGFHSDDVFAVATLELYLAQQGVEDIEVVRTRDEAVISEADYVVDVGAVYDPAEKRFDHHQKDSPAPRENGVPYASFGLVWKEYGAEICGGEATAQVIDEKLVQPIDGPDNGVFLSGPPEIEGVYPYFLGNVVSVFNPTWKEDADVVDERFLQLVEWAKVLLQREISVIKDVLEGEELTRKAYEAAEDKRLIYLEPKTPWKHVLKELPEPILVIYSNSEGRWRLYAVPEKDFSFSFAFPEEWRGKRGKELEEVAGVDGAIFCHRSLPMIVAETKEAVEQLAQKVLDSQ